MAFTLALLVTANIVFLVTYGIDPFHICGNAANLEDKTKEIFASVKNLIVLYSRLAAFPQTCNGSIGGTVFPSNESCCSCIYGQGQTATCLHVH